MSDAQRLSWELADATADESRRCMLAALAYLGIPERLTDVGCGPGHWCEVAHRLGAVVNGYDLTVVTGRPWRSIMSDLTKPQELAPADMVLCLEVAEHLPKSAANTLCDSVAAAVEPGGRLLWSAAIPGQGGAGHLNEQPPEYWVAKLESRCLDVCVSETKTLRSVWSEIAPNAWWYGRNIVVLHQPQGGTR